MQQRDLPSNVTQKYPQDLTRLFLPYRKNHSKCLVHCKMGVSRSVATVVAYAMKEYGWALDEAFNYVKQKRAAAQPNTAFMRQLAEYEGILNPR